MAETQKGIYYPDDYNAVADIPRDLRTMAESIDTAIENSEYDDAELTERIDTAETDIETLQGQVETLETQVADLEEQVQELENNQLTGTATGQSIYIEDSTNAKVRSIVLSGNSEQESTTGKNLFNIDNSELNKILSPGAGTTGGGSNIDTSDYIPVTSGTTYVLKGVTSESTYYYNYYVCLYDENKTFVERQTMTSLGSKAFSFIPSQSGYIRFSYIHNISDLQLEQGSTPTAYEPYTGGQASPNPSYPQEIHSTGDSGSVNEKVQNKNLFNLKEYLTDRGVRYTENSDGSLTFAAETVLYSQPLQFSQENITVSLSGLITNNSSNNARIHLLNSLNTNVGDIREGTNKLENVSACKIRLDWVSSGTVTMKNIQLEQGITATDYVSHEEQDISFLLAQGQKLMQGDYPADDGVHHVRGEVVFDGSDDEGWTLQSSSSARTVFQSQINGISIYTNNQDIPNLCSSHFIPVPQATTWKNGDISRSVNSNSIFLIMQANISIEDFKSWLAEQYTNGTPVKVQYELAEEVIDPYTEEQQAVWEQIKALRTYKPVTHISSEDEVPATVDVTYVKDLETVINEISSAIVAQGGV